MNCIIPGQNLKVLSKALQALWKIGDELYLEARKDVLTLITLNMSKTICGKFKFEDTFFSNYQITNLEGDESSPVTCKLHMKVILPLFKGNLEKKLDFLKLEYDGFGDFITFKMKYKQEIDMQMIHKLRLMESEMLSIGITTGSGSNDLLASNSLYNELLTMFSSNDDEITLEITKERVIVRNYCVGTPLRPKSMRSQIILNSTEFLHYQIDNETTINFSLKAFRTAIHFADSFNLNIGFNFETGGKPLTIIMKNPTYESNFIVGTLNPYTDLQSTLNSVTSSIPSKIIPRNPNPEIGDGLKETVDREVGVKVVGEECGNNLQNRIEIDKENIEDDLDVIPKSPDSPKTKRVKTVFGRCNEATFNEHLFGEMLTQSSDTN